MGGCIMKKSVLTLPMTLTGLLTLSLLITVFLRTFLPQLIFPRLDIPTVVLLCLAALLTEHWLSPQASHHYLMLAVLGAVNFGLLPLVAGFAAWRDALVLAGAGLVILPALTAVFTSIRHRLASGPKAPAAPVVCALCLYLAVQALRGVGL